VQASNQSYSADCEQLLNLFVEVTHTEESDLNTGIQRVVRNVLRQLLELAPPRGINVFPVVLSHGRFVTTTAEDVLREHTDNPLASPAVETGQTVGFAQSERPRRYMVSGWSVPEPWGTWSTGGRARLRLRAVLRGSPPNFLNLDVGAFCTRELPEQRVEVLVNGRAAASLRFDLETGETSKVAVPIPEEVWDGANGVVEIEFRTPDAKSPDELGLSADTRVLGVRLKRLQLSRGAEWETSPTAPDSRIDARASSATWSIDISDVIGHQAGVENVLLLLDSSWPYDVWPAVRRLRARGVRVVSVVYDLIPITHPYTCVAPLVGRFRDWMQGQARNADAVIGISNYVAQTVREYFQNSGTSRDIPVTWFHLGAELDFAGAKRSPSDRARQLAETGEPMFLMVGSIEPRKNHRQVLSAFDAAWKRGLRAQLVVVGAYAWKTEQLLADMQAHQEHGHRLHLVRDANDADLDFLYRHARALIIASEVEGFGLPIIEARRRGVPVIASEIPVFRELEDATTSFFQLGDVEGLVALLLDAAASPKPVMSADRMRWMTWSESTEQLLSRIEDLVPRLPPSDMSEAGRAAGVSRALLGLRAQLQRGRVALAPEGSIPADPYDPSYALLGVQARRVALSRLIAELQVVPLRRWPRTAILILIRYFDLRLSVALANALIAERSLGRLQKRK